MSDPISPQFPTNITLDELLAEGELRLETLKIAIAMAAEIAKEFDALSASCEAETRRKQKEVLSVTYEDTRKSAEEELSEAIGKFVLTILQEVQS